MSSLKRNLSDDDDDDHYRSESSNNKKRQNSFEPSGSHLKRKFTDSAKSSNLSDEEDTPVKSEKAPKEAPAPTTSKFDPLKMLSKMGYKPGEGLGKHNQGILQPIKESDQKGKHGLGFSTGKEGEKVDAWDFDNDPVSAKEEVEWLWNNNQSVPSLVTLAEWMKQGDKKYELDDEDEFCSRDIVKQVLECKSIFDDLDNIKMIKARSRANPFETIASCIFQNRAAMKMANIDSVFGYMFTNPKDPLGKTKVLSDEPLYFCDVCAGPGGFSEYVLWRKGFSAKGFGMTLKGDNDFKLNDFVAGAPEFFEPFYGVGGVDGDGDVTKTENLKEFQNFVREQTNGRGAHFFMADGGFSVEGKENIQEILSKQLYLCQFLCALSVLRTGGNFVCKLFDLFTPFSCGLIYLMYLCFERISLHKPVTSRPANSERYIVCEGMKECESIIEYLYQVNDELNKTFRNEGINDDISEIVPLDVMKNDTDFYNYMKNSNEKLGNVQILNLKKIKAFASNEQLFDHRQEELREECLKAWNIPDQVRPRVPKSRMNSKKVYQEYKQIKNPTEVFKKLSDEMRSSKVGHDINTVISKRLRELDVNYLKSTFEKCSIYDYRCMIASGELVLLIGCGRGNVYQCELKNIAHGIQWRKLNDFNDNENEMGFNIELPTDTLLLAEKVFEYRGDDKGQRSSKAIHIIDAFFIHGINMVVQNDRIVSLVERREKLRVFEQAIVKKSLILLDPIRVKELVKFEDLDSIFENLMLRRHKHRNHPYKYGIHLPLSNPSEIYVYPSGLYFFKFVENPWSINWSRSNMRKYYYNQKLGISTYDPPSEDSFCANPKSYWENGFIWKWSNETRVEDDYSESDLPEPNVNVLTKRRLFEFISSKMPNSAKR